MDIVVTLPACIEWEEYEKELAAADSCESLLLFKVPALPRFAHVGDRCFLLWRGLVRGSMTITAFLEDYAFTCEVTGKPWKGHFIARSGPFRPVARAIPMRGFRGFRYVRLAGREVAS